MGMIDDILESIMGKSEIKDAPRTMPFPDKPRYQELSNRVRPNMKIPMEDDYYQHVMKDFRPSENVEMREPAQYNDAQKWLMDKKADVSAYVQKLTRVGVPDPNVTAMLDRVVKESEATSASATPTEADTIGEHYRTRTPNTPTDMQTPQSIEDMPEDEYLAWKLAERNKRVPTRTPIAKNPRSTTTPKSWRDQ